MAGGGKKDEKEKLAPIVIKRIKKGGGGHHGGAWKVAYADFVTAMMAFFLLLWLLNVTTKEQKNAISNYFDPSNPKVSDVVSGAGGIMGGLSMSVDGAMVSTVQPISQPDVPDTTTRGEKQGEESAKNAKDLSEQQLEAELRKKEDERFKKAAEQLKEEISKSPDLKDMMNNIIVDITPEGLRIQIVDDKGRSMFPSGSAKMFDFMHEILTKVTSVIKGLPNQVSVRGHTDAAQYKNPSGYDNWNLSADRAQASRRVMVESGLPEKRIENVMGRADRDPLTPKDPAGPRNRRISIILLRDRLVVPPNAKKPAAAKPATPIKIIDDTVSPQGAAQAKGGTQQNAGGQPRNPAAQPGDFNTPPTPLPTTAGTSTLQPQPQVITFGDVVPARKDDSLYDGPVQSPYTGPNKPPTITTPAFDLPSNHKPKAATTGGSSIVMDAAPAAPAPAKDAPAPAPQAEAPLDFGGSTLVEKGTDGSVQKTLTFP